MAKNENKIPALIIDDDPEIHSILEIMLKFWGFEVHLADSAYQGVALAVKHQPVFIILDIEMPEINGKKTLKLLRAIERTSDIPIIILSGTLSKEVIAEVVSLGATDVMTKPFSHEMFFNRIIKIVPEEAKKHLNLKEFKSGLSGL